MGTLIFLHFMTAATATGSGVGGFATPLDDRRPLETPRGFADPSRAVAALDEVAVAIEAEYGTLEVAWGDALRFPTVRPSGPRPFLVLAHDGRAPFAHCTRMCAASRRRTAASRCPGTARPGSCSRRRDCHFADSPSPPLLKCLLKGEGMSAK